MKQASEKKTSSEKFSNFMHSTVDLGKKAAESAKNNVNAIVEKTKNESYKRKLKKYNPVFPEQYFSEEFNLPNMIVIVDDAVRRDIEICNGAIGWLSKQSDVEVLYLYDEAVETSRLTFVPSVTCDAIYYVDSFDRKRFIRTDCIFSKAHEERIAELKHVAYSLGAKKCVIEISESLSDLQVQNSNIEVSEQYRKIKSTETMNQNLLKKDSNRRSGHVEIEFEGNSEYTRPTLKWFAHDDNINRLIEMRCSGNNSIKSEHLELEGASSATMSQKTAYAIDTAVGKMGGAKGHTSMNSQAEKEHRSKFLYYIEF